MTQPNSWPSLTWIGITFLGAMFLMFNHFNAEGVKYGNSPDVTRFLAIRVSPVLLFTSGLLAMRQAHRLSSRYTLTRLVVLSLIFIPLTLIPLVSLELALYPQGHGIGPGLGIGLAHLPFVSVFLAGLWSAIRVYWPNRVALLRLLFSAPAGFVAGVVLVNIASLVLKGRISW